MLIRYGYEFTLTCAQRTALVCLLSVHEDRAADIRVPETTFTMPDVPISMYRDLFGNRCRRLVAPAGDILICGDAMIEDAGERCPQDRQDRDRARSRCGRCSSHQFIRTSCPEILSGLDLRGAGSNIAAHVICRAA
jgi:hypothetical protein